ncbi:TnpV protein [Lacrimispora sp. 38-1]|uniref:TnpV protein n=1 Tax=Lacrimispora sp. 38-1 TaxID=3125778 RepID=UPI003CEA3DC9
MNQTLTYKEVEGLLIPNITVPQNQEVNLTNLGKYGIMAMSYLKENEKSRYNSLYRFGKLAEKMMEVEEEANQLLDQLMERYLSKHKPQDLNSTMEMWKIREQAKMEAEEIVLQQIVYKFH